MEGIGTVAAIGGLLLALVLGYAVWRNGQRTRSDVRRTEEATKELYAQTDRQDQTTDPDPKTF